MKSGRLRVAIPGSGLRKGGFTEFLLILAVGADYNAFCSLELLQVI